MHEDIVRWRDQARYEQHRRDDADHKRRVEQEDKWEEARATAQRQREQMCDLLAQQIRDSGPPERRGVELAGSGADSDAERRAALQDFVLWAATIVHQTSVLPAAQAVSAAVDGGSRRLEGAIQQLNLTQAQELRTAAASLERGVGGISSGLGRVEAVVGGLGEGIADVGRQVSSLGQQAGQLGRVVIAEAAATRREVSSLGQQAGQLGRAAIAESATTRRELGRGLHELSELQRAGNATLGHIGHHAASIDTKVGQTNLHLRDLRRVIDERLDHLHEAAVAISATLEREVGAVHHRLDAAVSLLGHLVGQAERGLGSLEAIARNTATIADATSAPVETRQRDRIRLGLRSLRRCLLPEALRQFRMAEAEWEVGAELHLELGKLLALIGEGDQPPDPLKAARHLDKAERYDEGRDPALWEAIRYHRARLWLNAAAGSNGQDRTAAVAVAMVCLDDLLQRHPDHVEGLYQLARAKALCGDLVGCGAALHEAGQRDRRVLERLGADPALRDVDAASLRERVRRRIVRERHELLLAWVTRARSLFTLAETWDPVAPFPTSLLGVLLLPRRPPARPVNVARRALAAGEEALESDDLDAVSTAADALLDAVERLTLALQPCQEVLATHRVAVVVRLRTLARALPREVDGGLAVETEGGALDALRWPSEALYVAVMEARAVLDGIADEAESVRITNLRAWVERCHEWEVAEAKALEPMALWRAEVRQCAAVALHAAAERAAVARRAAIVEARWQAVGECVGTIAIAALVIGAIVVALQFIFYWIILPLLKSLCPVLVVMLVLGVVASLLGLGGGGKKG